jgi:Lipopolysaccharide-assembly
MHLNTWRLSGSLGSLALLSLFLPACSSDGHLNLFGYTTKPNYDTGIKTVYLPMAGNKTMMHGSVEFDLTRAIVNEIQSKTPYRVVHSPVGADTELTVLFKSRNKTVININQIGENREAQLGMVVEVIWKDLRPGHEGDILSSPKRKEGEPPPLDANGNPKPPVPVTITPFAFYIPEIGGSNASAMAQLYSKVATQITHMMEISGAGWR